MSKLTIEISGWEPVVDRAVSALSRGPVHVCPEPQITRNEVTTITDVAPEPPKADIDPFAVPAEPAAPTVDPVEEVRAMLLALSELTLDGVKAGHEAIPELVKPLGKVLNWQSAGRLDELKQKVSAKTDELKGKGAK